MLGRIAVAFMTFVIVVFVAAMCQNDEDASMIFSMIASLVIAFLTTVILTQNGVA